jgi:hypothetical protein
MAIDVEDWSPLPNTLPKELHAEVIYLLPERQGAGGSRAGEYFFTEDQRLLPKYARANGLPLEFSKKGDERTFLSEYATDPDSLSITLATLGWINDWVIGIVAIAIASSAAKRGAKSEKSKVIVSIAKLTKNGTTLKGIRLKGEAEGVLRELRALVEDTHS